MIGKALAAGLASNAGAQKKATEKTGESHFAHTSKASPPK